MIIVLVTDTFNINNNGVTISAMRFAESLKNHGHTVRIIACSGAGQIEDSLDSQYEMFYVPELVVPFASYFAHRQSTLFAKPVQSALKKAISGADVVHIYQPWALGKAAFRVAKQLGVPAIAAFHIQPENITYNIGMGWSAPLSHLIYYGLNIFFYSLFDHIHCPSKFIAAQLRSHGFKSWLHVISNGVHPDFYPGGCKEKPKDDLIRIIMVGRLSPEKRQDVLIQAVLKSKYRDKIQLHFAGQGPWEKKLQHMGQQLPLPPVIGYYNKEGLIELIRCCDLYVHASDVEIEGISCIEAFACGKVPIISNSIQSATTSFALKPENLFQAGHPESLAQRIDYWLDDPTNLSTAGKSYAEYGKGFALERSVRQMEKVYGTLSIHKQNEYHHGLLFQIISHFFYLFFAIPILIVWVRFVMGVKIKGKKNLVGLKGAITLCNHVHLLDGVLVAVALYPRKIVFPTLPKNLSSLWPGEIVKLLGGVPVPENIKELKIFFDEMELLLLKKRIIHFFPEGELQPYNTKLRGFKKGAFHLATEARVPLVPMTISFKKSCGIRKLIHKKPLMTLHIGKPIFPVAIDSPSDLQIRMEMAQEQMNHFLSEAFAS